MRTFLLFLFLSLCTISGFSQDLLVSTPDDAAVASHSSVNNLVVYPSKAIDNFRVDLRELIGSDANIFIYDSENTVVYSDSIKKIRRSYVAYSAFSLGLGLGHYTVKIISDNRLYQGKIFIM